MKFQSESADRAVRTVAAGYPLDLSLLAPIAEWLGSRVGAPLVVEQLQSGGWVRLAVDPEALAARIVASLTELDYVEDARIGPGGKQSIGAPLLRPVEVRIRPGTPQAKTLRKGSRDPRDKSFQGWIAQLEEHTALPLAAELNGNSLQLEPDLQRLTPSLLEKLEALPEIEAAQLNQLLESK